MFIINISDWPYIPSSQDITKEANSWITHNSMSNCRIDQVLVCPEKENQCFVFHQYPQIKRHGQPLEGSQELGCVQHTRL